MSDLLAFLGLMALGFGLLYLIACYVHGGPPRCQQCKRLCFPHQAFHEACLDALLRDHSRLPLTITDAEDDKRSGAAS